MLDRPNYIELLLLWANRQYSDLLPVIKIFQ